MMIISKQLQLIVWISYLGEPKSEGNVQEASQKNTLAALMRLLIDNWSYVYPVW